MESVASMQKDLGRSDVRTVLRPLLAAAALLAFAVPSLASAASTAAVPIRHLTSNGGRVTWSVRVHNPEWCAWSSSPNVAGFNTTVKCKSGVVERSFGFGANIDQGEGLHAQPDGARPDQDGRVPEGR